MSQYRLWKTGIEICPLISQRTVRVVETGYDLKLPIEATLTGEHRLFYELNLRNAATVSMMAQQAVRNLTDFGVQKDIAAIWSSTGMRWPTQCAAIIREPVVTGPDCYARCAVEFWDDIETGEADPQTFGICLEWVFRYTKILINGTLTLWTSGIAIEPHLQNVILLFDHSNRLVRIKVRDLDGSILIEELVLRGDSHYVSELASETWMHMPSSVDALRRLCHALMFGHLQLILPILEKCGVITGENVEKCIHAWIIDCARSLAIDDATIDVLMLSINVVKRSLRMHLCGANRNLYDSPHWLRDKSELRSR